MTNVVWPWGWVLFTVVVISMNCRRRRINPLAFLRDRRSLLIGGTASAAAFGAGLVSDHGFGGDPLGAVLYATWVFVSVALIVNWYWPAER